MPFEKPATVGSERGGIRALLLAAALLSAALLLLRVGSVHLPKEEQDGALFAVVEHEAVRTFLGLDELDEME